MWYHMEFNGIDPESQKAKLIDTDEKFSQAVSEHSYVYIYPIIRHKSVDVRKLQVAILARSPRKMSQTDRILPKYILSRVRVSVRPKKNLYAKKPQTTVARPAAVDHRSAADKQLNLNGHNPFSWVAQRQELSAKTLLRSAAIRVQTPCREQYFFHFYCLRLTRLTFNKS